MRAIEIISSFYDELSSKISGGIIPIQLKPPSLIGTVQDDHFDSWVEDEIRKCMPDVEVYHAGKLTTPDIVLRDPKSNTIIGLEVKKLIQQSSGSDPRGLTIDYNSCLPCGKALIKVGNNTIEIPCFYLFALLNPDSSSMVTTILMDGDFLNYDFDLHKDAKYANQSEYNHGPYGEGSVRHRRMYTYPNPLNYKLEFFHLRHILVIKKHDSPDLAKDMPCTDLVIRSDRYKNSFHYLVFDNNSDKHLQLDKLPVHHDIFKDCKNREPKARTASMPNIPVKGEG